MPEIHGKRYKYGDIVVFTWDEIFTWTSADFKWLEVENDRCNENCTMDDCGDREYWKEVFQSKSSDSHYPDIVESLNTYGFLTSLTVVWPDDENERPTHLDGNHRLAAAFELGLKAVPYRLLNPVRDYFWGGESRGVANDSQGWRKGMPIRDSGSKADIVVG